MELPSTLTIHVCGIARDGGSRSMWCTDERGVRCVIELHQRMYFHTYRLWSTDPQMIPGRLHLDRRPLEPRSATEAGLIALLRSAEYRQDFRVMLFADGNPGRTRPGQPVMDEAAEKVMRTRVAEVISAVESEAYIAFAARLAGEEFDEGIGRRSDP